MDKEQAEAYRVVAGIVLAAIDRDESRYLELANAYLAEDGLTDVERYARMEHLSRAAVGFLVACSEQLRVFDRAFIESIAVRFSSGELG